MRGTLRSVGAMLTVALVALLAFAPAAFAADGVGIGGPTDDRKVTYWAFGTMIFFAVLVTVLALMQTRRENRKERLRRDLERVQRPAP